MSNIKRLIEQANKLKEGDNIEIVISGELQERLNGKVTTIKKMTHKTLQIETTVSHEKYEDTLTIGVTNVKENVEPGDYIGAYFASSDYNIMSEDLPSKSLNLKEIKIEKNKK